MSNHNQFSQDGQDDFFEFDAYSNGDERYSYEDQYLNSDDDDLNEDDQEDTYDDDDDDQDDFDDNEVDEADNNELANDYAGKSTTNKNDNPVYIKDMPPIDGARPGIV